MIRKTLNGGRARAALDIVTTVTLLVAASVMIYRNLLGAGEQRGSPKAPTEAMKYADAETKGDDAAPVLLVIYSDFQCPYCGRFAKEVLPQIEREFVATNRVELVFQHLPLPNHPYAERAAVSAECARSQGKFWEMHDRLFAMPLTQTSGQEHAEALGMDVDAFHRCMEDSKPLDVVRRSYATATALGLRSTPSFYLGTRSEEGGVKVQQVLQGIASVDEFREKIQALTAPKRWFGWL